ncbi:hypothetical protein PVAND_003613 [Polypedilum vanderplanki]|uniref:Vacuolar fusion protein CCZ1-like protein n=1 Tax=Polypedilum vanderplanki TaxID=319348 RepID=A0A9J6BUK3_POLVA|nr:hypothetical protein PVAND_003613 [Polypedilum vanderplanki]
MLRTKISLKNFFIFNSTYGPREGEEEKKILFFYPDIGKNEKLKDIGFIEALIKFTGTFSLEHTHTSANDVLTMKTKKTMKFFFEPEKNFWIVISLNVPFERKEKDKKEYIEYYADDVHDSVFKKILQRSYYNFRLFENTFEDNLVGDSQDEKIDHLKTKLNQFYTKYLLTINLQNADILDAIQCLQYKSIFYKTFFKIVNFINILISIKNLKIKKCIFLYNQEIVYSSVNPRDLFLINEYMTELLFPKFFQSMQRNSNQGGSEIETEIDGKFVTGNVSDESLHNDAPKLHLYSEGANNGECETYRMAIYNILNVSLVMLVEDDDETLGEEFCNEIRISIGPQMKIISKEISDNINQFQQIKNNDDNILEKYIYFNHKNFRFHACFYNNENAISNRDGKRNTQLSSSVMNLLCDLYAQESDNFHNNSEISSERETIIKTYNDFWIVRKFYNFRSFYLILHKNSTLIDIAEESQRLLSEIVKNVYFTNQK